MWTASRLSRFCAHANVLSEMHPKKTRDAAAAKGKTFHAALEEWFKTGAIPSVDDDDVRAWLQIMVDNGWAWPDGCEVETCWGLDTFGHFNAVEETEPHVYRSLAGDDLLTAGRADCAWVHNGLLVVADWKTGRSDAPHADENLQLGAAGIALAGKWKARGYIPTLYYAREGRWQPGNEVIAGTPEWAAMFDAVRDAARLDENPHPGPHCGSCWEKKNCAATI
jgi:hypothetical protein